MSETEFELRPFAASMSRITELVTCLARAITQLAPRKPQPQPLVKNAALYQQILDWAAGQVPGTGALAGVAWDNSGWYYHDMVHGLRTYCCAGGAAIILSGGTFSDPRPVPGAVVYRRVRTPDGQVADAPSPVAAALLGLTADEAQIVFDPDRTLGDLKAMLPCFTGNTPITNAVTAAAVLAAEMADRDHEVLAWHDEILAERAESPGVPWEPGALPFGLYLDDGGLLGGVPVPAPRVSAEAVSR